MVTIQKDVLSVELLARIKGWVYSQALPLTGTNLDSWDPKLVRLSGAILLRDISGNKKEAILDELKPYFPDGYTDTSKIRVTHTYMGRLAYIPWHDDHTNQLTMTIYLNEVWDKDWAGFFVYEDVFGMKAVLPKYNTAVIMKPPVEHCVVAPTLDAPLRESLQLFFG